LLTMATPFVLIFTIGKLIAEAAGAKDGLEMDTVSDSCAVAWVELAEPTTVTGAVQLVVPEGPDGEKPSCPAEREALSVSVPELPALNRSGETPIPDGRPVSVKSIIPGYELSLTVTVTGTPCCPG
jgi:hypothetical protein